MLRLQGAARSARSTATALGARHRSCSQPCVPPRRVAVSIDARMLWHCWAAFCCQLLPPKTAFSWEGNWQLCSAWGVQGAQCRDNAGSLWARVGRVWVLCAGSDPGGCQAVGGWPASPHGGRCR